MVRKVEEIPLAVHRYPHGKTPYDSKLPARAVAVWEGRSRVEQQGARLVLVGGEDAALASIRADDYATEPTTDELIAMVERELATIPQPDPWRAEDELPAEQLVWRLRFEALGFIRDYRQGRADRARAAVLALDRFRQIQLLRMEREALSARRARKGWKKGGHSSAKEKVSVARGDLDHELNTLMAARTKSQLRNQKAAVAFAQRGLSVKRGADAIRKRLHVLGLLPKKFERKSRI